MTSLPTFSSPCISPDSTGQKAYLFGVPSPGRLEAHSLDLSNPLAPTSTFISATALTTGATWNVQYSLGCYAYLGDSSLPNSPISLIQFGTTAQAQFYPINGTWVTTSTVTEIGVVYTNPRFFSLVGSTMGWNWFLATAASKTGTGWRDVRIGNGAAAGSQDLTMTGSDASSLLLSVGAIAQDLANYGNGILFTFDQSGSFGNVYRAAGNKKPEHNLTSTDALVNLTKISAVDMSGIVLTGEAVPVTSAFAAFILDKGPGGTISVFSIDPRSSAYKLVQSTVGNLSPLFLSNQSVTSINSQIIVYGGLSQNGAAASSNTIHIFDVIAGAWSGPGLVNPAAVTGAGKATGGISTAIIGAIAAVVVILMIGLGVVVWRIRGKKDVKKQEEIRKQQQELNSLDQGNKDAMIKLLTMEHKAQSMKASSGRSGERGMSKHHSTSSRSHQHDRRNTNESGATLIDGGGRAASAPNTPTSSKRPAHEVDVKRAHTHHGHQDQSRDRRRSSKPGQPSRQTSAYSLRSDTSSSHISLFPAGSSIFLVDSPSMLPPTPMIPSAYSTNAIESYAQTERQQQLQIPYAHGSSSVSTPSANNNSKKHMVYRVNVPNDYDDRQPLHRHDQGDSSSAADEHFYQMSTTVASSASPASVNMSWTGGHDTMQHSDRARQVKPSARKEGGSLSQPASLRSNSVYGGDADQLLSATSASVGAETRQRRKKSAPAYPRSKTDPLLNTTSTKSKDLQYDSGTYKVEYTEAMGSRRYQQQSSTAFTPTTPVPNSQAFSPTSANFSTTSNSFTPSESDARFTEAFPMPPKPKTPTSPTNQTSSPRYAESSSSASTEHRSRRQQQRSTQQQQQQHLDWYQQQQLIHDEQQEAMSPAGNGFMPQTPKTPKLWSLPRPIPREPKK